VSELSPAAYVIAPDLPGFGESDAPVGFHIAMQAPERVLGLIIKNKNANAHRTGFGPQCPGTLMLDFIRRTQRTRWSDVPSLR
jgi:hypothetical protein